jgi:ribosomal protein L14
VLGDGGGARDGTRACRARCHRRRRPRAPACAPYGSIYATVYWARPTRTQRSVKAVVSSTLYQNRERDYKLVGFPRPSARILQSTRELRGVLADGCELRDRVDRNGRRAALNQGRVRACVHLRRASGHHDDAPGPHELATRIRCSSTSTRECQRAAGRPVLLAKQALDGSRQLGHERTTRVGAARARQLRHERTTRVGALRANQLCIRVPAGDMDEIQSSENSKRLATDRELER